MKFTGRFSLAAILCCGFAAAAFAQGAPASPQKVAVLVGFRNDQASPPLSRYETWLIVRDATGVHIAAKLKDIIVPRKSGFWRIGVQDTCEFTPPAFAGDRGNYRTADAFFAVPIEKAPEIKLAGQPCDEKTAARLLDPTHDSYAVEPPPENAPTECGVATTSVEGVLPDMIAVGEHQGQSEQCEPRGGHWMDTQAVWDLNVPDANGFFEQVKLETIFGEAGIRAWNKAVRADRRKSEFSCEDFTNADSNVIDWFFSHGSGAWQVIAFVQLGNGMCQFSGATGLQMPRRLTSEPALPPWLAALSGKQSEPDTAMDAWISPDGRTALRIKSSGPMGTDAYQVKEAGLFDSSSQKIGMSLLELPAQRIVMVQWATGSYVDQWVHVLEPIARKGLPAPTLRSAASHQENQMQPPGTPRQHHEAD